MSSLHSETAYISIFIYLVKGSGFSLARGERLSYNLNNENKGIYCFIRRIRTAAG